MANRNFKATLAYEKSTKGTHVFAADVGDDGMPPAISSLYIAKWKLGKNPPASIEITVVPSDTSVEPITK